MHNKNVRSKFFTADAQVCPQPCWLHGAYLVVSAAGSDSYLYDGHGTGGEKIVTLESAVATGHPFTPPKPIYCKQGLYLDVGTNVTGIFVQWEEDVSGRPPAPTGPGEESQG